jgi:hypothetical protein
VGSSEARLSRNCYFRLKNSPSCTFSFELQPRLHTTNEERIAFPANSVT